MTDELGPLPEPAYPALRDGDLQTAPWEVDCWTADQVREYGRQERAAQRAEIIEALGAMLHCPCCGETMDCAADCTFSTDCPDEAASLAVLRDAVRA